MSPGDLDAEVRRDLRGLQKETAESVARHLVAAGLLVDDDPVQALEHARYARRRAARIAVVREAAGIVAYHAGEWTEALGDLRAARRMGGGSGYVPMMADIERALGRPERALDLARGPEARGLEQDERIELLIVAAGARRDLGELDAAVVGLQVPELEPSRRDPWSARLFYAYADNLLAAGRRSEAVQWFVHAYDADEEQDTDAAARIADLTGDAPPGADMDDDSFLVGEEDVPFGESATPATADTPAEPVVNADQAENAVVEATGESVTGADGAAADLSVDGPGHEARSGPADLAETGTADAGGEVPDNTSADEVLSAASDGDVADTASGVDVPDTASEGDGAGTASGDEVTDIASGDDLADTAAGVDVPGTASGGDGAGTASSLDVADTASGDDAAGGAVDREVPSDPPESR